MTTIAGIAAGDPNFSILLNAINFLDRRLDTDLAATLSDPNADLTVFAPTNDAFASLAQQLGYTGNPESVAGVSLFLAANVPAETLLDVILYHVLPEALDSTEIGASDTLTTLNNLTITPDLPTLVDNEPDAIDPSLIDTDIMADNGIVHVIDEVLLPVDLPQITSQTITALVSESGGTFDQNDGDFDILLNAVVAADLAGVLDDPNADLTVFAPTDAAFIGLATSLGFTGTDEGEAFAYIVDALTLLGGGDPIPLLTEVLELHVAGESLQESQIVAAGTVDTLQGGTLTLVDGELVDPGPVRDYPDLIATDIQNVNGVVHVIDGVLLPLDPADVLEGELVITTDANEQIRTFDGNDLIDANGGNDFIFSGSGDDFILGGAGDDLIFAGSGSNTVNGGTGNDRIVSASNSSPAMEGTGDTFVFATGDGDDTVFGFDEGDVLDLSDAVTFGGGQFDLSVDVTSDGTLVSYGEDSVLLVGFEGLTLDNVDFGIMS